MNWRDQKREASRVVHETMSIGGKYYPVGGANPVDISVRVHTKFRVIGDDRSMGWPEMQEVRPKLVFMRGELLDKGITLDRQAIVCVYPGEAYRIDNVLRPDDITVSVEVSMLTDRQLAEAGLPEWVTP